MSRLHAGRFEDKAALVRKAALQLAGALLVYNPFGAFLALEPLQASLQEHQQRLQVVHAALHALSLRNLWTGLTCRAVWTVMLT